METGPGGVIAYIKSSFRSIGPFSSQSEPSEFGIHTSVSSSSSSSSLPPSPNSSVSENSSNSGSNTSSNESCYPISQPTTGPQLEAKHSSDDLKMKSCSRGMGKPNGLLLMCKVCGDVASGFHYGVHACEGCKGFFRRSIQQNTQYRKCMEKGSCYVAKLSRNRCQPCRLKKCLSVGMSRDAVRFGRIPKQEKQRMLLEMQIAMKTMMSDQFSNPLQKGAPGDRPPLSPLAQRPPLHVKPADQAQQDVTRPTHVLPPAAHISKEEVIRRVTRVQQDTFMYNQESLGEPALGHVGSVHGSERHANPQNQPLSNKSCHVGHRYPPRSGLHGLHRCSDQVGQPDRHAVRFTGRNGTECSNRPQHCTCSQAPAIRGTCNGLPSNYSRAAVHKTHLVCPMSRTPCIDPLKSGQQVWEEFAMSYTPAVKEVVEFAKRIPGFRNLSQQDQIHLLKAGSLEVLMVRFASLFDAKERAVTFLSGKKYSVDELQSMGAGVLLKSMFEFSDKLRALRLTEEEMSLFTAVVLVSADRSGIENVNSVEALQEMLLRALKALIGKNHPNEASTFTKLLLKLPDLRSLSNMHSEELLAFKIHQ